MQMLTTIFMALMLSPYLHAALPLEDANKLLKLIGQYREASQKTSIIKQINKLKAQYANDKDALVEIEKEFNAVQTGLAASYEKSLQDQEERERNALLQRWSPVDVKANKDLEKEIARVAKSLRARNRFLTALKLEEGLTELQKTKDGKFVNPEEEYRKNLPEIMKNLDYGLYQDGDNNTPQKLFYQLQQLVQAANTYLLLNTIPNSWATYSGLRTTIEDLVVKLQMNDPGKIRYIFEQKLTTQAQGIDDGIQDTLARCNQLQKQEFLLIDASNFDVARKILAQAPKFAQLAENTFTTWVESKEPTVIKLSELNLDQSKKTSWFGELSGEQGYTRQLLSSKIPESFDIYYKQINGDYAAQAFVLGHNLPTTPYALLWRLIPPNDKDLAGKQMFPNEFIDGLKKLIGKLGNKNLRQASIELQTIIAATAALKKALEAQNIAADHINLALYPWRLEISERLANLQWAILLFHDYFEQQLKIVTPELFIASLLTDNEIYALPSKNEKPLSAKIFAKALGETANLKQDFTIFDNAAEADKKLIAIQKNVVLQAFEIAFPDTEIGDKLPHLNSQREKIKVSESLNELLDQDLPKKLGIFDIIPDLEPGLDFFEGYLKMLKDQTIASARKKPLYQFTSEDTEESLNKRIAQARAKLKKLGEKLNEVQIHSESFSDTSQAFKAFDNAKNDVLALNQKLAVLQWNKLPISRKNYALQARKEEDINSIKRIAIGGVLATVIGAVNVAEAHHYVKTQADLSREYPFAVLSGRIEVHTRFMSINDLYLGELPKATDQSTYQTPSDQQILDYLPSSEAEVPINAFTIGYYFCGSFTDQTPEFVIFLEISTIINNLQLVEYLSKQLATTDLKPEIRALFFDFAHNRAWQHLTIINKAIEKIRARNTKEDQALAAKIAAKIATFRSNLTKYFDQKQSKPAPVAS